MGKKFDEWKFSERMPLEVGAGGGLLTAALLGASHGHDRRAAEYYLEKGGIPRGSKKFEAEMKKWRKNRLYQSVMLTLLGGVLSSSSALGWQISHELDRPEWKKK